MSKPKPHRIDHHKKRSPGKADTGILLKQALKHHQAGESTEAESIYRQILTLDPRHPDALHLLGIIHHRRCEYDKAFELISQAILKNPGCAHFHNSLGNTLISLKKLEEARDCYERALKLKPDLPEAINNLAFLELNCHHYEKAESLYRKVLEINPQKAEAHYYLGLVLYRLQKYGEAAESFHSSLRLRPKHAESYFQIAKTLHATGNLSEIVTLMRFMIGFDRTNKKAWSYLISAHEEMRQYMQAMDCIQEALAIMPDEALILMELGNVYFSLGEMEKSAAAIQRALESDPNHPGMRSNLLFYITHSPSLSPDEQLCKHRDWAERFETPHLAQQPTFTNSRDPERKLRIGYISPDFRKHSVAYFIEPILAAHDTQRYETYCYMNSESGDHMTNRIRSYACHWRQIDGFSDEDVQEVLQQDQPDILVDLSGHTAQNRLPLFARRAAPIQVAWIGYPNTTGLVNMDYRLVDKWTDPEGSADRIHTEQLVRLPHGFSVYLPPADSPAPVETLPANEAGWILFASFNNLPKINEEVIATWAAILEHIPDSRLLIKCKQMGDEPTRMRITNLFTRRGIQAGRILNLSYIPENTSHLEAYNKVDIGLDTFPFNGATTTCEAVWMGVPVITLAGERHAGRVGVSILNRLGLPELVATTREEYVRIAVELALDRKRLCDLRLGMRQRVQASSLVDSILITRSVEEAYRKMWRRWCATGNNRSAAPEESSTIPEIRAGE